ncbi:MAG: DUF2089 domain-containing protein [Betaproteobacteria bacterium]
MEKMVPARCPVCEAALEVKRLECPACGTGIDGTFGLCKFCRLAPEQREFMEVFLAARGSIKEVERVLGISYPTVRSRLNALLEALGYPAEPADSPAEGRAAKREVLQALSRGEIDVNEALRLMRKD